MTSRMQHESTSRPDEMQATPIVFVVDDDVSMRESLETLIRSMGWQPQIFACAHEFLSRPRVLVACCLVLDILLPDLDGLDLQNRVADRIDMPIIFLSGYGDVPTTVRAMRAGAVDFLTKPVAEDTLMGAIVNAIRRSRAALAQAQEMRTLRESYASLSRREREVMSLVVSGRLNKLVGDDLGISEVTVKAHRARMMNKMRAGSLAELVRMAERLRLAPGANG